MDGGLTPGAAYSYRVTASNGAGASPASAVASGTPGGGSGGAAFPSAGLQLWLKADAGVTQNANGAVSGWADQSGNGHDASQPAAGSQPMCISAAAAGNNGWPTVRFDGASDTLSLPGSFGQDDYTLVAVIRPAATRRIDAEGSSGIAGTSGQRYLFGGWMGNAEAGTCVSAGTNGISVYEHAGDYLPPLSVYAGDLSAGYASVGVRYTAKQAQILVNGALRHTGLVSPRAHVDAPTILGGLAYGDYAGDVAEVLLFSRSLSAAEYQAVESYLNGKYAYNTAPPTPVQLGVQAVSATQVLLSWTEASSNVSGYTVERQNPDGTWSVVATPGAGTASYLDGGLTPGTSYSYRVSAANGVGSSPASAAASGATSAAGGSFPTAGLQLWLKADAGISLDAGGGISSWADQSGAGHPASQASAGQQPTLATGVLNGRPVVRFDAGRSQFFNLPDVFGAASATAGEVIMVLRSTAAPGASNGLDRLGAAGDWYPYSDGHLYGFFGSAAQFNEGAAPAAVSGQFNIYDRSSQAGLWQSWLNGTLFFQSLANTVAFTAAPLLGYNGPGGACFTGDVAEVLAYNRVLGDAERQAVESYLNGKYAVVALPGVPAAPAATAVSATQADLLWTAASNALGYLVERKDVTAGGDFTQIAAITGGEVQAYLDGGLTSGHTYAYRLRAENPAGDSDYSAEAGVTLSLAGGAALPADDLLLWLRPDLGVTQDADGKVTAWSDASGHGYNALAYSGSEPTWTPNIANGQPALHFDGSASYLQLPAGFSDFTGGLSALVVARPAAPASWQRLFDFGNGTPSDNLFLARNGTSSDLTYAAFSGGGLSALATAPGALTPGACELLAAVQDPAAGTVTLFKNGAQAGRSGAPPPGNVTRLHNFIGKSNWSSDALFGGDIAEVLLFDHGLTDAERQAWEQYLNAKYQFNPPPSALTQLAATALSATQASLAWVDSFADIAGYRVERQNPDGTWTLVAALGPDSTSYVVSGLAPGTAYTFRVTAFNGTGDSPVATVALTTPAGGMALPVGDLRLWLRADSGTLTDANGNLSQWLDRSGHGLSATQAGTGNQPAVAAGALNGLPTVHFDGSSSFLNLPGNVMAGLGAAEVFVVLRAADPVAGVQRGFWRFSDASIAEYPWSDGNIYDTFGTNGQYGFSPGAAPLDQFNLYNVAAATGAWTARMNGQVLRSSAANAVNFSAGAYTLGQDRDGRRFAGDVAELLIFSRTLSDAERQAVEQYLAGKYALASAPAAPSNLGARALSPTQVSLVWQYPAGASAVRFGIQRQSAGGGYQTIATVENATSFIDSTAVAGAGYSYQIVATDLAGNVSAASSVTSVSTPATGSALPTSGMRLWLAADAGTTGVLNDWVDQSGNGNDAQQGTAGRQPTVVANALNGQPAVHFDGGSDFLYLPASVTSGLTGAEVFVVLRAADPVTNVQHGFWRFDDASIAEYPWSDGNVYETFGTNGQYGFSPGAAPLDQFNLYNVSAAATGAWTARMNGQVLRSSAANAVRFSAGEYTLGRERDGRLFAGDIAELIIFDHALAASDRVAVEQYLAGKYALAAAPAAPAGLSVRALSPTQVSLTWEYPAAGTGSQFTIERTAAGTNSYQAVATVDNATSFIDNTALAGAAYSYQIVATDLAGNVSAASNAAAATTPPVGAALPTAGLRLWLAADAGATAVLDDWVDQSGSGNDAQQGSAGSQPSVVPNVLNGCPVVRFNGQSVLQLPASVCAGLTGAEVFAVLRAADPLTNNSGLWRLNDASDTWYPYSNGAIYETFGSSSQYGPIASPVPLDQFSLYNVSAAATGMWTMRMNEQVLFHTASNTPNFAAGAYLLGQNRPGNRFYGDIAEILIFDHALGDAERLAVEEYLAGKYRLAAAPTPPTALAVRALSPSQVSLTWAYPPGSSATQFTVERAPAGTNAYQFVAVVNNATSFLDSTAAAGTAYSYKVFATDLAGNVSADSSTVQASTPASGAALPTAGLRVWLQGDAGATSGKLASWVDQSGYGNDAQQGTPGNQPTVVPGALNGQPVVRFDGNDVLQFPSSVLAGTNAAEVFAVLRAADPLTNNSGLWRLNDASDAWYPYGNGAIYDTFGSSAQRGPVAPPAPLDQFNLYNVSAAPGAWTMRMNEQVLFHTSDNLPSFAAGTYLLGQNRPGNRFYGDIAEVLIFDHALTDTDRLAVERYLAGKYALAAAPAAPTALALRALSPSQVSLTWRYPLGDSATQFTVQRAVAGTDSYQVIAVVNNATSLIDQSAAAGVAYSYRVAATDLAGNVSANSAAAQAATPLNGTTLPTTGLRVWLEADAGTTGTTLASWVDQSGSGNDAQQGTPGNQPTVKANVINGQPVVRFDGTGVLQLPGNPLAGAAGAEVFAVLRAADPLTNNSGLWRLNDASDAWYPYSNGAIYDTFGSSSQYGPIASPAPLDQFNLYNVSSDVNAWTMRMNEQVLFRTASNTPSFSAGAYLIGQNRPGYRFYGDIAEILIFDHALTDANRLAVEAYLAGKYALVASPPAPTKLKAHALSGTQASLTWKYPETNDASQFTVKRAPAGTDDYQAVGVVNDGTAYVDASASPNTAYNYEVLAVDLAGNVSAASAPVSVSTPASGVALPTVGLRVWLKADAGTTGTTLASWVDQSGNGNDAQQGTPGNQPTVKADALNGQPVVRFDGTGVLQLPGSVFNGVAEAEIFAVLRAADPLTNNSGLWRLNDASDAWYPYSNGAIYDTFGSSAQHGPIAPSAPLDQFNLYNVSAAAGAWISRVNERELARTADNTASFAAGAYLLGQNRPGYRFYGDIAEILIFDHVLTAAEHDRVAWYLAAKYLLADYDLTGDGLTTAQKQALGLDPFKADANGDGLTDGTAIQLGLNPLAAGGFNFRTPPGPTGSGGNPPPADPGDHTPPVITLTAPANAVPLP